MNSAPDPTSASGSRTCFRAGLLIVLLAAALLLSSGDMAGLRKHLQPRDADPVSAGQGGRRAPGGPVMITRGRGKPELLARGAVLEVTPNYPGRLAEIFKPRPLAELLSKPERPQPHTTAEEQAVREEILSAITVVHVTIQDVAFEDPDVLCLQVTLGSLVLGQKTTSVDPARLVLSLTHSSQVAAVVTGTLNPVPLGQRAPFVLSAAETQDRVLRFRIDPTYPSTRLSMRCGDDGVTLLDVMHPTAWEPLAKAGEAARRVEMERLEGEYEERRRRREDLLDRARAAEEGDGAQEALDALEREESEKAGQRGYSNEERGRQREILLARARAAGEGAGAQEALDALERVEALDKLQREESEKAGQRGYSISSAFPLRWDHPTTTRGAERWQPLGLPDGDCDSAREVTIRMARLRARLRERQERAQQVLSQAELLATAGDYEAALRVVDGVDGLAKQLEKSEEFRALKRRIEASYVRITLLERAKTLLEGDANAGAVAEARDRLTRARRLEPTVPGLDEMELRLRIVERRLKRAASAPDGTVYVEADVASGRGIYVRRRPVTNREWHDSLPPGRRRPAPWFTGEVPMSAADEPVSDVTIAEAAAFAAARGERLPTAEERRAIRTALKLRDIDGEPVGGALSNGFRTVRDASEGKSDERKPGESPAATEPTAPPPGFKKAQALANEGNRLWEENKVTEAREKLTAAQKLLEPMAAKPPIHPLVAKSLKLCKDLIDDIDSR